MLSTEDLYFHVGLLYTVERKEELKKRIYYVVFACCILGIVGMYLLGFRITYNPELDNNWDAIAAIGTWCAAIISGIAVVFAVTVPKSIAAYQNQISLFERRLSVLYTLEDVVDVFIKTDDETIADFYPYLGAWICHKENSNNYKVSSLAYELENIVKTCESVSFLFPINFSEDYFGFLNEFKEFVMYYNLEKKCDSLEEKRVEKLTNYAIHISENEMKKMKKYIDLTKIEL